LPSGWLKKLDPPKPAENSILNRALIDYQTNKRISDKAPSVYLAEIRAAHADGKLQEILASHLIPYEGHGALGNDNLEAFLGARERLLLGAIASVTGAAVPADEGTTETYLDPKRPFTNELALRRVIRELRGRVLWYEQHMGIKTLEILVDEIDRDNVTDLRLLSGPANVTHRLRRGFERFASELQHDGIDAGWRVLPADAARQFHARVLFDDETIWELPPLNSLLQGTVDSIRPSSMPRARFEEAWAREDARPLAELRLEPTGS